MPQSSENKTPVASLASFFHALNAMPSALFICKPDGVATITHANRRALELTGYESQSGLQDLCGTSFCDFVHPCDHETVASAFQSNSPSLSTGRIACSIIRADGCIRRVNLSIHRSHDADCGPILCVFVEDITDRVLIDEELRRSKMIIGALSEEYISIFLLHIASGTVRSYRRNDYFFTQVHSSFEEGVDLSWQTVFEPYGETFVCADDRTRFFEELSPKTIGERIRRESSYAISYRQGEGEEQRFMEISIADAALDGPFSHAILGVRDVTALAQHIRETLETQFEIEGAQALEQKTNEAKSAFLFNISHDIRTPMNSIMGFTELARRHLHEPDVLLTYLDKVDFSNRHLITLIDELLEMSRLDSCRVQNHVIPCDLHDKLEAVCQSMRGVFAEHNQDFQVINDIPPGDVYIDPIHFCRVIDNLLTNAQKFTPSGGRIVVRAHATQHSQSGYARYEIRVQDNGIGIDAKNLTTIFGAFERAESASETRTTGTGLGLTITRRLLDLMGGSIIVESVKGEGSTFTVFLPLRRVLVTEGIEESPAPTITVASPEVSEEAHPVQGKRILLVEDIEINRILAETVLTEAGFEVESVTDGSDAVEAVRRAPEWYYDLVLMDIQMPVMNGYEATKLIRQLDRNDVMNLPIVALSANARAEDRVSSIDSGMNEHVAKPFDVTSLIKTIKNHITRSRKS